MSNNTVSVSLPKAIKNKHFPPILNFQMDNTYVGTFSQKVNDPANVTDYLGHTHILQN